MLKLDRFSNLHHVDIKDLRIYIFSRYFISQKRWSNDVGSFSGGCCHTYIDKGYEFDVGIHYIGDVGYPTMFRVLLDQVTDGQLQWAPLEETFDYTSIGYGEENRKYPIIAGT